MMYFFSPMVHLIVGFVPWGSSKGWRVKSFDGMGAIVRPEKRMLLLVYV
jgi:hypothetical protein